MRRTLITTIAGILLAGSLPSSAEAQQDLQNLALVYKLFMDEVLLVERGGIGGTDEQGQTGQILNNGDFLATSDNTRAAIRFVDDGSIIRMNPESELTIRAEGERSALRKTIEIDVGELWAKVTKRDNAEYRIQTPTAVAAVKGTEFYVRVAQDGTTTIITTEGVLDFFTGVGTVEIPVGSTGTVATANDIPVVSPTTPGEIESFGDLAGETGTGADDEVVIIIPFMDAEGNQKTMIIRLPRDAAQQYLPPALN
jgi:hypothetical protein